MNKNVAKVSVQGLMFVLVLSLISLGSNNTVKVASTTVVLDDYSTIREAVETPTVPAALLQSTLANIHFIDVGWGDAIFIDTHGKDVLIDGGYSQAGPIVLEYLTNLGIACVDLMVVTHPHPDHYGGLMAILGSPIEVGQVLFNNENHPYAFLQLAQSHNLTAANRGQIFALADDVALQVLNPIQPLQILPTDWSRHYNNIVLKLQAGNTSFLFTGDANALAEQNMINAGMDLPSDVLKVAIHGCGEGTWENVTSQGFLDKVNPSYAVISCDYSNGAGVIVPDPFVAGRLLGSNITTYTTYLMGTVIAYTDGTSITFSNNTDNQYAAELKGHTRAVYSVAWSPDETLLASGSKDGTVRLWNTTTWNSVRTINAHALGVWSVAWSPDGTMLATGGVENAARLWNPETGEQLTIFNTPSNVFSVSWSPDGGRLAAGLSNGNVCVFDVETGEMVHVLSGHSNVVVCTAWASDGNRLASGSIDGSVRIWDSRSGSTLFTLHANTKVRNDINGLAWSHDDAILAAAGQDGNVRLWNTSLGTEMQVASHHDQGWCRGVSWSPDDVFLSTTGQDYFVRLVCPKVGRISVALPGHLSPVWSVAWSRSGRLLASGSGTYETAGGDTRVLIWNMSTIQDGVVVVPDESATIQEAINKAVDGDAVLVKVGTYYEHVVVNKTISLVGEDGSTTIIDGNGTGHVLDVIRNNVNVTDFTVQRGGSTMFPDFDAGISLNNSKGCTISSNNVVDNGCFGIHLLNSDRNTISGNSLTRNAMCAIYLTTSNNNTLSGNTLTGGQFGIEILNSTQNKIFDNNMINNTQQVRIVSGSVNVWDDGYPSGGNYWSEYGGTDFYHGYYQNETGSDGVGDVPYVIDENNQDNYPLKKPYPWATHDIAITGIAASQNIAGQGYNLSIKTMVFNYGNYAETTKVIIYANETAIGEINNVHIVSRNYAIAVLEWNTSGFTKGNYTISVYAEPVPGETCIIDNNLRSCFVTLTIPGDVNGDGSCDMQDISILIDNFIAVLPNWNPNSDINNDLIIDMADISIATDHFMQS